ncbi:FemAB family XrtA/PEP-CTERM system-associated protein [Aureliella helgolandensis]|uniref:FemAB family protein n=1 Tax=Aureliella helgolandensis TaxID=2527968 RepID=A0A518GE23_9BACT|nr:FemAB family XrtA/PEP-CTERM system-associated protein [Aureliella helgolandensis]QDV26854.1 FemAB family protein [Aureliella helgolandensis]
MDIELLPGDEWPAMEVADCEFPRLNSHQQGWLQAVCRGLSHRPYLLVHRSDRGEVDGLLPLAFVKSLLFGRFLTSMPYLNTGGVWAADPQVASALIDRGCRLADELNTRYLELRHEHRVEHPKLNAERTDKVHMRLPLPASDDELNSSFKSKLRSQIRKSGDFGLSLEWGSENLLADFYHVFSINMRDLGTPVYSRRLFAEILKAFPEEAELCVVRQEGRPIAGALLTHLNQISEVPSASCLRKFNRTNANMWMYRNLLRRAIERGSQCFDFGRSSRDSGTYKFKAQWGAQPHPAIWQYYVRKGSPEDMRPDAGGKQKLVELWKKLPVPISRLLGPHIVRGIP